MDYAQLQAEVVEMLKDTQVDLQKAQSFITRAEPKLERDLIDNRYGGAIPRQMQARIEGNSNTDSTYTLPSDYLRACSVRVNGTYMRYAAPEQVPSAADGYSEVGVTLDYYQKLVPLSATAPTNWLLTDAFDVYLWAACVQYPIWGQETETAALWADYYTDALKSLKNANQPQPRGGLRGHKDVRKGGRYSVQGSLMRFAS